MEFSPQQDVAMLDVNAWFKTFPEPNEEGTPNLIKPFFYLAGYAGTGKTTIIQHMLEDFGMNGVVFGAYTGKAALVMQRNGLPASTIHSLIYKYIPPSKSYYEEVKAKHEKAASKEAKAQLKQEMAEAQKGHFELNTEDSRLLKSRLCVIDEVSMVDQEMGVDLLSFKVPILVLGDPGQLPPIEGTGYFTAGEPDIMLTEIHRQAKDNPIIRMATLARTVGKIPLGDYGESKVVPKGQINGEMATSADQMLCGMHRTRRPAIQNFRRGLNHFGPIPEAGERLICLKNNAKLGIFNGLQFDVKEAKLFELDEEKIDATLISEDPENKKPIDLRMHRAHFMEYDYPGSVKKLHYWEWQQAEQFDYGYCITVHKAQGSQWDRVVFINDGFGRWSGAQPGLHKRWLYTGVTRAAEQLTLGV